MVDIASIKHGNWTNWLAVGLFWASFAILPANAAPTMTSASCTRLSTLALAELPDAPTTILTASITEAASSNAQRVQPDSLAGTPMAATSVAASTDVPAYCRVTGIVAPEVAFELRMPSDGWNGKFLMQGCGGMCGIVNMEAAEDALVRGYAVANTNMGHSGNASTTSWARNNYATRIDFGWRSTHVVVLASKTLIQSYYGVAPRLSYFRGYSTGGRQAMFEAQRFPDDFNGIIAGAAVLDETGDALLHLVWSARASVDESGKSLFDASKIELVHQAVLAACDNLDGVRDHVLQDPTKCHWQPSALLCKGALGADCLSAAEVEVVDKIYKGAVNAQGHKLYPGGMSRGSELGWVPLFIGSTKPNPWGIPPGQPLWLSSKPELLVRYLAIDSDPGPSFSLLHIDLEKTIDRIRLTEPLYDARNPDLREFQARGGKLLMFQGWNDVEVPPGVAIDYYQLASRTMGGADITRAFFRLFMIPGMGHARGGEGADAIDYLAALEAWVEDNHAPDLLMSYHLVTPQNYMGLPAIRYPLESSRYDYRRPVYPYPAVAAWDGAGDPNSPDSWHPTMP